MKKTLKYATTLCFIISSTAFAGNTAKLNDFKQEGIVQNFSDVLALNNEQDKKHFQLNSKLSDLHQSTNTAEDSEKSNSLDSNFAALLETQQIKSKKIAFKEKLQLKKEAALYLQLGAI